MISLDGGEEGNVILKIFLSWGTCLCSTSCVGWTLAPLFVEKKNKKIREKEQETPRRGVSSRSIPCTWSPAAAARGTRGCVLLPVPTAGQAQPNNFSSAVLKGWVCCLFKHTAAFQSCTHSTAMGLLVSSPGELQESKSRTGIPMECKEAWSAAGSCEMLLFLSFKPFSPCPSIHNCLRKAERKLAYIAAPRRQGLLLQASFVFLIRHLNLSSSSSSCTSEFTPNRRNRNEIEKKNK